MSSYVLVHGAWHGAWCWRELVPALEAHGHRARALDLPGHGDDPTPTKEVTLERYVAAVVRALEAEPEPVILVGHSMGGVVITQVAEEVPERIHTLVYLAAIVPRPGDDLMQAGRDPDSLLAGNLVVSDDGVSMTVRPEVVRQLFYADCSDEQVDFARRHLVPQATAIGAAAVHTTDARFGRVPRVYVECLKDRALTPALQKRYYTSTPFDRVLSLPTSHSPFFSAPDTLAAHLSDLARP